MTNPASRRLLAIALCGWAIGCAGATRPASVNEPRLASRDDVSISLSAPRRHAVTSLLTSPIVIDGRLDDAAWATGKSYSRFWQREPDEGKPARFRTQFHIVYDKAAIYVGVRAFDPEPEKISRRLTRRDEDSSSDWIYVSFDSYQDKRTAFSFGLSAAGVQRDLLRYNDTENDQGWNAVWEGVAGVDDQGWVAEVRIPFSQLRYSDDREKLWGLQVSRFVQRANEWSVWSPQPRDSGRDVSLFGSLGGLDQVASSRRFEIVPYGTIGAAFENADGADPLNNDGEVLSGAGLDFKVGLGSNFTLSGAISPDFGQVEADPSQVNLSANEIFFAEKRPFFLEGTDIFSVPIDSGGNPEQLFYSRRIGARPHDTGDGYATYFHQPGETTILGAAKLSGKTASGWSVGVLEAVTAEESAELAAADGARSDRVIEPLTNFSVLRVKKDYNAGHTTVGAIATGVHRALADTELGDSLHRQGYSGAVEVGHRWGGARYGVELKVLGSHVRGDAAAIDETQRAAQRYYQRPDADHLDYDPGRTSLSGFSASGAIGKWSGGHWRFGTGFRSLSPGFEVNDIGFQQQADRHLQWAWGQYWDAEPGRFLRLLSVNAELFGVWDYDAVGLSRGTSTNFNFTFNNYWSARGNIGIDDARQSVGDLRGGPMLRRDRIVNGSFGFSSDSRANLTIGASAFGFTAPANGSRGFNVSPSISWQAKSNLALSLGPSLGIHTDNNQYVAELVDATGTSRYIMARIDQVTTALTLRASYTLSPTLSFQLYGQPFVSVGEYSEYKDVVSPQAKDYDDRYRVFADAAVTRAGDTIVIDDTGDGSGDLVLDVPDFSFGQLRSTAVARWEYRAGSTLFLIWSHNRTSAVSQGRFGFGEDYGDLADEPGEHVILLKLNYWFGV